MENTEENISELEQKLNKFFAKYLKGLYKATVFILMLLLVIYLFSNDLDCGEYSIKHLSELFKENKDFQNSIEKSNFYTINKFLYSHSLIIYFIFSGLVLVYVFERYKKENATNFEYSTYGILWLSASILLWLLNTIFVFYFPILLERYYSIAKIPDDFNLFLQGISKSFSIMNTAFIWIGTKYISIKKTNNETQEKYNNWKQRIYRNENKNLILIAIFLVFLIILLLIIPFEVSIRKFCILLINLCFSLVAIPFIAYVLLKVSDNRELPINKNLLILFIVLLVISQFVDVLISLLPDVALKSKILNAITEILSPSGPAMYLIFITSFIIIVYSWLYEKLEDQKRKDEKAMSHTIKGMLNYLDGHLLELLLEGKVDSCKKTFEQTKAKINAMEKVYDLIHQSKDLNPHFETFIISICVELEKALKENINVEFIEFTGKSNLELTHNQARQIAQVLTELCINSCRAAEKIGFKNILISIIVDAKKVYTKNIIQFIYKDNCGGIDEALFEKDEKTMKYKSKSEGYGLDFIFNLIEELKGELLDIKKLILDDKESCGTLFKFIIPYDLKIVTYNNNQENG